MIKIFIKKTKQQINGATAKVHQFFQRALPPAAVMEYLANSVAVLSALYLVAKFLYGISP